MKNGRKNAALVLVSMALGAALASPAANAAQAVLSALPSTQRFFVDGAAVQMEAYSINGNNYVKVRDLGKAVGFNVSYDATSNSVQIDSTAPYAEDVPAPQATQGKRTVTLPTDGSKYVPRLGDLIPCGDGTVYEVKDVSRFENNCFAPGALPELPTPTCDWGAFPALELPSPEVRHFANSGGKDVLFVRNVYETRRMQYTLYNALGKEPSAWRDGKPLATVALSIPAGYEAYTGHFYPWRASEIEKQASATPTARFYIEAWDFYADGVFQFTRYAILPI